MTTAPAWPRGWDGHRRDQERRWRELTPAERLRGLELMRELWLAAARRHGWPLHKESHPPA